MDGLIRSAQYLVKKFLGAYRRLNKSRQQKNRCVLSKIFFWTFQSYWRNVIKN